MSQQTSQAEIDAEVARIRYFVGHNWGWFLALGIMFVLAGTAAIVFPFLSTIATKIALGWIFLLTGAVNVIHAFGTKEWRGFALNLLVGLLFLVAGGWLAFFPLTGIITLTILLAAVFLAEGYLECLLALRLRPDTGWVWILISGLIAIAAGGMIAFQLPGSAVWALGLITGINLLASGWSFIFLALSSRNATSPARTASA
ncbi:MAG: HdeD family acid-resistance protein [Hyphomicrobiaceae bacterium]|jgi:uncharacterized membrane protein HdeD (DUF308 family)